MANLTIVTFGNPVLLKKTMPVDCIDKEIHKLIKNMFETMYNAPGVGLAANQVAVPLSVCVIDVKPGGRTQQLALINPYIKEKKGRVYAEEGCLSLPGIFVKIPRWEQVTVSAINEKGLPIEIRAEGFLSRALQHEIDHLSGKLLLHRVGLLKKLKLTHTIQNLKKQGKWK